MDSSTQYERDLRSAGKAHKREKNAHAKWAFGARPLPGIRDNFGEIKGGDEISRSKARPERRPDWEYRPKKHNVVKIVRGNYEQPHHLVRTAISAKEALADTADSRSIADMLRETAPHTGRSDLVSPVDNVLYSFDDSQSPNLPMALDIFVKATGRETEKLVEREYEVLDEHGDALKGRKARKNLRKPSGPHLDDDAVEEDDGFELV